MAALKHLAKMPMGYFDANPSGKLRKIIDDNSFQTETFIAHQLPRLGGSAGHDDREFGADAGL